MLMTIIKEYPKDLLSMAVMLRRARDCMVSRYYGPNTASLERRPPSDNSDMSLINLSNSTETLMLSNTPPTAQLSRPSGRSQT